MQSVSQAFTDKVNADVRKLDWRVFMSFKKEIDPDIELFTVGVSAFDSGAIWAGASDELQAWDKYTYSEYSDRVIDFEVTKEMNNVLGSSIMSIADIRFNNTDRHFESEVTQIATDGYSLDFDGTNDYVNCGDDASLDTDGAYSITAWAKLDALQQAVIFGNDDNASPRGVSGGIIGASGNVYFEDSNVGQYDTGNAVTAGSWNHFAFCLGTPSGGSQNIKIYLNNSLIYNNTITATQTPPTPTFSIGRRNYPGFEGYWNGLIDGVRFYNTQLDATGVDSDYNNSPDETDLISEWLFDEGSGTSATDTQGSNTGTISGATYSTDVADVFIGSVIEDDPDDIGAYVLPKRPIRISYGVSGTSLPQFIGLTEKMPKLDERSKIASFHCIDFIKAIYDIKLDQSTVYQDMRTDEIIDDLLQTYAGLVPAQYELDIGTNTIPVAFVTKNDKLGKTIEALVEAENGRFYMDEEGVIRFKNLTNIANSQAPLWYFDRSNVIDSHTIPDDNIINRVEIKSKIRQVLPFQIVMQQTFSQSGEEDQFSILPGETKYKFFELPDPCISLAIPVPTFNSQSDGSGSDLTSSVTIDSYTLFTTAVKITFENTGSNRAFLTALSLSGEPAKVVREISYIDKDQDSIDIFDEQNIVIDNNFIQTKNFAKSLASYILTDFANPNQLREITVKSVPQLQVGDLITYDDGVDVASYLVYKIVDQYSEGGITQRLSLIKKNIYTFFQYGVSAFDGGDVFAP